MDKWDAINEGGEGWRPVRRETIPASIRERMQLIDRHDTIMSILTCTSTEDPRYGQLSAELNEINTALGI